MPALDRTIKDFVIEDFRTAAVFEKYGLDFCCGGGQPLDQACQKNGIDTGALQRDLDEAVTSPLPSGANPADWETEALIDHILNVHHRYVHGILPVLVEHARKVARVHGFNHPETVEIAAHVEAVAGEMEAHMAKEEQVLFPHVRRMAEARQHGDATPDSCFGTVQFPIRMMEMEHQAAGDEMAAVRSLSGGYEPPADACTTYRVLYQELAQFEADLHRHVHLENNILFPRAIEMEQTAA